MKRFLAVVPASLLLTIMNTAAPEMASRSNPRLRYDDLSAPLPAALPAHSIVLTIENGDTLESVLVDGGLDRSDAATLTREAARSFDLRRLQPGNLVRFHYEPAGNVDTVQMKITGWGELDAVRNENGFLVVPQQAPIREIESVISAHIDSSLYDALMSAGEGPQLAQQIVDIFQWDIDFFALQRGDSFSLVVRKRFSGSDPLGYGPVLAAQFTHSGQTYEAFRQEMPDGRAGYYARNGSPLRKQFLRAPLQFTRITSKFSKSRWHPILHCFRPHNGVDYGAPVGTPVWASATGRVVEMGMKRGSGNTIVLGHTNGLTTRYYHLSRYARGLSVALKNDGDQAGDLVGDFDFSINEQCIEYGECSQLTPFIAANKAVFNCEYNTSLATMCAQATTRSLSSIKKRLDLGAWVQTCP